MYKLQELIDRLNGLPFLWQLYFLVKIMSLSARGRVELVSAPLLVVGLITTANFTFGNNTNVFWAGFLVALLIVAIILFFIWPRNRK